jgi:formamidopyrimidine-DNA glycosylase
MPELPEVQTVVSDLNAKIKGAIITDFWSEWKKTIKGMTVKEFKQGIIGRKILRTQRLGKNIFINLSGGKTIYIHLKMTGHLLIKKVTSKKEGYFADKVNQYIHHIFYLNQGRTLEFSDMRKFGKIVLVDTKEIKNLPEIKKLGIDAINPKFTLKKFTEILKQKSAKGKPILGEKKIGWVLMEQNLIAGIGNIYRSEILFEAKIHPERLVKKLKREEIKRIYNSLRKILKKALKYRGTSDSDYRDTAGAPGNFQEKLRVYKKDGQKCQKCDTIIKRSKIGQRSVFYCPQCQK